MDRCAVCTVQRARRELRSRRLSKRGNRNRSRAHLAAKRNLQRIYHSTLLDVECWTITVHAIGGALLLRHFLGAPQRSHKNMDCACLIARHMVVIPKKWSGAWTIDPVYRYWTRAGTVVDGKVEYLDLFR